MRRRLVELVLLLPLPLLIGCVGGYRPQPGTAPEDYCWVQDRPAVPDEPALVITPSVATPWAPALHGQVAPAILGSTVTAVEGAVLRLGPHPKAVAPYGARFTFVRLDGGDFTQTDSNWTGKDNPWPRTPWPLDSRNLERGSGRDFGAVQAEEIQLQQLQGLDGFSWR